MPPALQRVEASSRLLEDACQILKADPYSSVGRKKLIEGARGILQGTSALLLCFDESEVRKIIRGCRKVLDYLAVTEVIESMDDLAQFVKVNSFLFSIVSLRFCSGRGIIFQIIYSAVSNNFQFCDLVIGCIYCMTFRISVRG